MKKHLIVSLLAAFAFSFFFCACSKSGNSEKGFVERTNEEMSKKAVDYLHKPIDKAAAVSDMAKTRVKDMDQQ